MIDFFAEERWMERLAKQAESVKMTAPSRLKSKVYSMLIGEQQVSELATLSDCEKHGFGLCVFEKLVQIAPVGERVEKINYCRVCHARVLGERMENAPIFWQYCPYASFQNH